MMVAVVGIGNMSSSSLLLNSSDEQTTDAMPRYAEHFVGAAALVGAFGLVFGAMALGTPSTITAG